MTDRPIATISGLILSRREDHNVGLEFEGQTWTWQQVVTESLRRAAMLRSLRHEGPFHVGVLLENVPEYLFLLAGAALSGATIVGINPTRRGAELERDIRHTDCQLIISDERRRELLGGLDLGLAGDRVLDITDPAWTARLAGLGDPVAPDDPADPNAQFLLIFTSGSTGAPKAVRVTQGRLARSGSLGLTPADVLYCAMPLFHGNALAGCWVPAMASGARLVLRRRFSASGFLPDIREHGVTYLNTVGRVLSYVLATPPSPEDSQNSLKMVLAPEASPRDVAAFRQRFSCRVIDGYGSSEGVISMRSLRGCPAGSLGKPVGNADVAVVSSATRAECPPARFGPGGQLLNSQEAIGEIVRRDAGSTFEGYYNNEQAQADRVRDGWYFSGDLGYRDADGWFYFAGRQGDWIRVDGENFSATAVERIIERFPLATSVAAYGVPDPHSGDQVMVALETATPASFDPAAFADFLAAQPDLGVKWAPRFVRVTGRCRSPPPAKSTSSHCGWNGGRRPARTT